MNIIIIILIGLFFRLTYLFQKTGNVLLPDLGGDSCSAYNIAYNISVGIGPKTNFILTYWFDHNKIPAMTDLYGVGYYYFLSLFLMVKDEFIFLRLSSLLVGLSSILLAYFIGKNVHSKKLGYLSALIICFNYFHIENSTVVMRENFNLLLVQLFFLNLFLLKKNNYLFITIGLITGYFAITNSGWIILLIPFVIYIFLNFKKDYNLFYKLSLSSISFILITLPWAYSSYQYFGEIFFAITSYVPFTENAGTMYWKTGGIPNKIEYLQNLNLTEYLEKHFIFGLKNLISGHKYVFPTFIYFLSFILLPTIFIAAWKLRSNGFILIIFTILYFLGICFTSYSTGGALFPRHYMPLLSTISILLGYGLIHIDYKLTNFEVYKKIIGKVVNYKILIILIPIFITVAGINIKPSFWERNNEYFFKFGEEIKNVTNPDDVIMHHLTVSDAWCVSRRNYVNDLLDSKNPNHEIYDKNLLIKIEKYGINYLLLDFSDHIYPRSDKGPPKRIVNNYYSILKLKEIIKDETNGFYLYKLIK